MGGSADAACKSESAMKSYWMSDNGLGSKAHITLTTQIAEEPCDARRQNRDFRVILVTLKTPSLCNTRLDL